MQRSPRESQLRCLLALKTLFAHAPYDHNQYEGIAKMRARMEIYDEQNDDPEQFLKSIVDIAKKHTGMKIKDFVALTEDKSKEKEKGKLLLNYVAAIDVKNPKHFVHDSVQLGKSTYTIFRDGAPVAVPEQPIRRHSVDHEQTEAVAEAEIVVEKSKPQRSPRGEVSPRSQPQLKRQDSRTIEDRTTLFASKADANLTPDRKYKSACYDLIKGTKTRLDKYEISNQELDFKMKTISIIKTLGLAYKQGSTVDSGQNARELLEKAKEFMDLFYQTYVTNNQKNEPTLFLEVFHVLYKNNILGKLSKYATLEDLKQVQEQCAVVYSRYNEVVNEKVLDSLPKKKNMAGK